ncbi:MAG: serine/threonine protein kinase [Candidatus Obscuribacterales bacterium]|nr:serine/threonine protein kinase [Candidatus Obscuribacterales bacterium]
MTSSASQNSSQLTELSEPKVLPSGFVLDSKYEILSLLGSGAKGVVYKARRTVFDDFCTIKILRQELISKEDSFARFQREARIASQLSHPNILSVRSFGISPDDYAYIVMDYMEGETLAEYLVKHKRLSPDFFIKCFSQLLSALDYAHRAGVIHRDIKPANIFLDTDEHGAKRARLIDLGMAKVFESENEDLKLTQTGVLAGTPLYMSPEQCRGESLSPATDIYSISVLMFEAILGEAPFRGANDLLVMQSHLNEEARFPANSRVADPLRHIVLQGLSKNPNERLSAQEMKQKLDSMNLDELNVSEDRSKKTPSNIKIIALAMLIGILPLAFYLSTARESSEDADHLVLSQKNPDKKSLKPLKLKARGCEEILAQLSSLISESGYRNNNAQIMQGIDLAAQAISAAQREKNLELILRANLAYLDASVSEPIEMQISRLRRMEKLIAGSSNISNPLKMRVHRELGEALLENYAYAEAKNEFVLGASICDEGSLDRLRNLKDAALCYQKLGDYKMAEKSVQDLLKNYGLDEGLVLEALGIEAESYALSGQQSKVRKLLEYIKPVAVCVANDSLRASLVNVGNVCREKAYSKESRLAFEIVSAIAENISVAEKKRVDHLNDKLMKGLIKKSPILKPED